MSELAWDLFDAFMTTVGLVAIIFGGGSWLCDALDRKWPR